MRSSLMRIYLSVCVCVFLSPGFLVHRTMEKRNRGPLVFASPLFASTVSRTLAFFSPALAHDKLSLLQSLLVTFRIPDRRFFGEKRRRKRKWTAIISGGRGERRGRGLQVALASRNRKFAGVRESIWKAVCAEHVRKLLG